MYIFVVFLLLLNVFNSDELFHILDTAWLLITLSDRNDNPPRFSSPYYTATVQEGSCNSSFPLVTLIAVDDDLAKHGPPFTFEIASNGNPGNRFRLGNTKDKTTELYCAGSFDRESTPDLKVIVKVTDNPTAKDAPKLSSTVNVFVHVLDVDESSESDAALKVIVNVVGDDFSGGRIAKTYFQGDDGDDDVHGITYDLIGIDSFKLSYILSE